MFATVFLGVLLIMLLAPSWIVLAHVGRLKAGEVLRRAWLIWIGLVLAAAGLIFLADAIGLTNPLGYTLGIIVALGVAGAGFFWRQIGERE